MGFLSFACGVWVVVFREDLLGLFPWFACSFIMFFPVLCSHLDSFHHGDRDLDAQVGCRVFLLTAKGSKGVYCFYLYPSTVFWAFMVCGFGLKGNYGWVSTSE